MNLRVGLGYDVHAVGGDRPLVLGGVRVDGPGLVGHSDADAIAHAVADALLGAAQLPDLGTLFPADDDRYRDAELDRAAAGGRRPRHRARVGRSRTSMSSSSPSGRGSRRTGRP